MQGKVFNFLVPSGFSSLVSLPCLLWLMLNSPHTDNPDDGTLRQVLCGIHIISRYTKNYFFNQLFFYSSLWRTFLILYAEGFIREGKLNLDLFVQLFWVISITFILHHGKTNDWPMMSHPKYVLNDFYLVPFIICLSLKYQTRVSW